MIFTKIIIDKHNHNACIGQYDFFQLININLLVFINILICYFCIIYTSIDYKSCQSSSILSIFVNYFGIIQTGTRNNLQVLGKFSPA